MTDDDAGSYWPGMDERSVVEEMMRDRYSHHWEECRKVVKQRVYVRAKNIPIHHQEEIIQEVMVKMVRYLPGFRFRCRLKTWLSLVIENCIIDVHRTLRNEGQFFAHHSDALDENDYEGGLRILNETWSAENTFLLSEELRKGIAALLEYATLHSNPIRDRLIIRMVIFDGHTHIEAAKAAGCSGPVVGYVVREAQRYAREKMGPL